MAQKLKSTLMEKFGKHDYYLCSSFDPEGKQHDQKKYWRGPVWINLNWILYHGLRRYQFEETAKRVKNDSLELVDTLGFYEYFNPSKKTSKLLRTSLITFFNAIIDEIVPSNCLPP